MKTWSRLTSLAAVLALGSIGSTATAAVYNYNIAVDTSAFTSVTAAGILYKSAFFSITPATDNPGDQYNIDVTFNHRVFVAGSETFSDVYAGFYDTRAFFGGTSTDALESSTTTLLGYMGPPNIGTSFTDYSEDGYDSSAGFFAPNPGFSLTGFDASITVLTQDAYPLAGLIVGSAVGVPEPAPWAMMLLGVGMIGGGLRIARCKSSVVLTTA